MSESSRRIILMADDDPEDCLLARIAFEESKIKGEILFVEDGRQLIEYLRKEGPYSIPTYSPRPGVILLDLNMPCMDGRKALREIKSDTDLAEIPVVIFTTSRHDRDVQFCMAAGACEFKTKPIEIAEWVEVIHSVIHFAG